MTMHSSLPVIFLITGAWHVPQHYQLLSNRLRHHGYTVQCPLLETNNNARPPNRRLDDDVHMIRNMVVECLDAGRDVVALMHSYGGIVGSSALSGLGVADRKDGGCVKALIYMAAFLPLENESLAGIFGGRLPPFLTPNKEGFIDIDNPPHDFYHDLSPEEQKRCTELLVAHPTIAQFEPMIGSSPSAAWRNIPVTYILCIDDKALPVQVQEMMINRIEQAKSDLRVDRDYIPSSHTPFISTPDKVIVVVERVCSTALQMDAEQSLVV